MSIVNLAHGSLYMLEPSGYFIWSALRDMQFSFWLSVLLAGLAVAAAGLILEFLLRPFYRRGHTDQIRFTYAFMYIIADLVKMFWGVDITPFPGPPDWREPYHRRNHSADLQSVHHRRLALHCGPFMVLIGQDQIGENHQGCRVWIERWSAFWGFVCPGCLRSSSHRRFCCWSSGLLAAPMGQYCSGHGC